MKSLLIILPSRGRPDKIKKCLDSYIATTDGTFSEILVQLDMDDTRIDEYRNLIRTYDEDRIKFSIRARPSLNKNVYCLTRIINRAFYADRNREYYCVVNDDMVFETKDWDKILAIPWAISTGHERIMIGKHGEWKDQTPIAGFPITSVIDGRIIRELGWLQMPELGGGCGDNAWFWIGLRAKNLIYNKNMVYSHNHCEFGMADMDDTYRPIYGDNNAGALEDYKRFIDWAKYRANKDIKIVKDLIEKNIGFGANAPQPLKEEELCTVAQ